ncbi:acyl-CoA dehydrogenase family protein [Mucilaginibacter arboris]|uniref:Acyl-CoA dehydrogenase n=1 Tax=Mucilaginibacter arboris TaxID=2682090 RepID=A0A7K1SS03_9SPHI|nr:acyl-CoA dehydrogenase [Mucilaginibacter arboris]MVN20098.1 acyl-CoA dehydrogenase [Mucilaginibacter arboris]
MNISHPSTLLQPEWIEIIRSGAAKAEETGLLQPKQLELIYQQQWFKLLVPQVYSGTEKPLPEMVRLEESLAWAEGSVGWVITLCSGAGWFGGFMSVKTASAIFKGENVCLAGSGAFNGTATKTNDGFIISGKWKYASGAQHATHFTANCLIKEARETVLNENGDPLILSFIINAKDVTLIPAWKYMGMMGTGSDAFEVKDLFVPAARSFKIDPDSAVIERPLYRYPFLQLAEATLAANLSGMAIRFMDLAEVIFQEKIGQNKLSSTQKSVLRNTFKTLEAAFNQIRQAFYQAVDQSWVLLLSDEKSMVKEALQEVSKTSRQLAKTARETVDELYPYCGLLAASPDTEINRVWRDLHTASQHSLLTFSA